MEDIKDMAQARRLVAQLRGRVEELNADLASVRDLLYASHEANTNLAAQVQQVLAERATAKFSLLSGPVDTITDTKAQGIMVERGMKKTGYVLQSEAGGACIVHMGAVRWLSHDELWRVVHPGSGT